MKVGYDVSSWTESEETRLARRHHLQEQGCITIYLDTLDGGSQRRIELEKALNGLREYDVLVVEGLHVLGHTPEHISTVFNRIHRAGACIRCLDVHLDSSTPGGKLLLPLLADLSRKEKEALQDRFEVAERVYAQKHAKYIGRSEALNIHRRRVALVALSQGISISNTARALGVAPVTVSRIWNEYLAYENHWDQ